MTKDQILEYASSLPEQQRIDLVLDLWDTINGVETPMSEAHKQELDRRIAQDDGDADKSENWDELKVELLRGEF